MKTDRSVRRIRKLQITAVSSLVALVALLELRVAFHCGFDLARRTAPTNSASQPWTGAAGLPELMLARR